MATWWERERGADADPDAEVSRRATRAIALEIAAMSAAMVISGAVLLLAVLWADAKRHGRRDPVTGALLVHLDFSDATGLTAVGTIGVVALAGIGTLVLARRAIRPLEESMRRQRTFVSDASHELRTPLAVASARSQQLVIMARGDAKVARVAEELHEDIKVMTDIVNDMLASVTGAGPGAAATLGPLLDQVVADMSLVASARGIRLEVTGGTGVSAPRPVALPEGELRRVLTSVIDNAIGYSPSDGVIGVNVRDTPGVVEVRVSDHGPGITGIEPARIFERFAHGAQPTTGDTTRTSHGIGLALVHDVLASRGGSIAIEHTGPDGTTFLLRLPHSAGGPGTAEEAVTPDGH